MAQDNSSSSSDENKAPFEGTLVYVAPDGQWIAGAPSRDITAQEWVEKGYSNRANFTPEDLVKSGLYELKPNKAKPGKATATPAKEDATAPEPNSDKSDNTR